jgi:hypothetical protein
MIGIVNRQVAAPGRGLARAMGLAFIIALAVTSAFGPSIARANPFDTPGTILYVRSYSAGASSFALVRLSQGGTACGTDTYTINLSDPGGQGMLAVAMEALALGSTVTPEISNATGCTGWGTALQSLMITS